MGAGDELMAAGEARRAQMSDPRKVAILDKHGQARWHAIWEGNLRIATPEEVHAGADVQTIVNGSSVRPYLRAESNRVQFYYTDFRATPGELYLSDAEKAFARQCKGAIVIEPNLKTGAPRTKDWGWENWKRLASLLADLPLVQLGPDGTRVLRNVRHVVTRDARQGAGALSGARAAVLPEGFLHHACAALGIPAVVIFGGYISPKTTGYDAHVNLFTGGEACGMRGACPHCVAAMRAISPERVATALRELLRA